ncbi:hypothetical protein B0H14DRAFT_3128354 [Mycena olivaceomarginata]|nr:hypothetical protein B0H14DRAFT_3128354 [Mycena olivaceomarginata]
MRCSLEGSESNEMCRAVSTRQALEGLEKWEKESTWVCNALWAREKLSWTWGNATGARRAARSVKIGIQGLKAARRREKMSAGLEEQRIKVSRGGLTQAENHAEERIGERRRITFLLNEPTTPVLSPLSDAPMDVDPVESNIEAQVEECRGEKRRRDETPGDEEVPEPRSSKIAKASCMLHQTSLNISFGE